MLLLLSLVAGAAEYTWNLGGVVDHAPTSDEVESLFPAGTTVAIEMVLAEQVRLPGGDEGFTQSHTAETGLTSLRLEVGGYVWTQAEAGRWTITRDTLSDPAIGSFDSQIDLVGDAIVDSNGGTFQPQLAQLFFYNGSEDDFPALQPTPEPPSMDGYGNKRLRIVFNDYATTPTQHNLYFTLADATLEPVDSCPATPKDAPGLCGCDFEDVDVNGDLTADSCVHFDANVDPGATLGSNVRVFAYASVGAATIGDNSTIGVRAVVEDGASIGPESVVGRRARVAEDADIAGALTLARSAVVRPRTQATGALTLGYGAGVGPDAVLGSEIVLGALVDAEQLVAGDNVVLARNVQALGTVTLGDGTVIGPDVLLGDGSVLGENVRVRKNAQLGERVTVGDGGVVGRDTEMANDAGLGANGTLRADVSLGVFAHLPAGAYAPRGEAYPDHYDHDDDGEPSLAMGGLDCNDYVSDAVVNGECVPSIASIDGARQWSDGSYATSCDAYRNPTGEYAYAGDVGNGLYAVDYGGAEPEQVLCDMSGADGWTLAAKLESGSSSNWLYDSTWWTSAAAVVHSDPNLAAGESRYAPFTAQAFTGIRLRDETSLREIHLGNGGTSLVDFFASTPLNGITPNGNGGYANTSATTSAVVERYDTGSLGFISNFNALSICSNSASNEAWVPGGLYLNFQGAYRASDGNATSGRVRFGIWHSGSNSHIWSQTSDCGFGVGVVTSRASATLQSGTTFGDRTTLWVR